MDKLKQSKKYQTEARAINEALKIKYNSYTEKQLEVYNEILPHYAGAD